MGTESDPAQRAFEAELAVLRRHFLEGLPARRAALAAAWQECRDGAAEAAWLRLREAAHKLAGSAPCYGMEALGAAARELDRALSGRPPCRVRARLQPRVLQVFAELDAAIGTA